MSDISPIENDVKAFVLSLGKSVDAMPHENKHIHSHLMKQIELGAKKKSEEYLKGQRGYEPVFVYEKSGLTIKKRMFHPRDVWGADFILTKYAKGSRALGVTAVQVKRNHGQDHYEFRKREMKQFRNFLDYWGSGYYLFVDETSNPPSDCFVSTQELYRIIRKVSKNQPIDFSKRTLISNGDVNGYCRGLKPFYGFFYSCFRGEKMPARTFLSRVREYTSEVYRIAIELLLIPKRQR